MLGGRYETLKAIASGGMATVHLGRAVGVGGFERLVAIKVMHPHIAGESEFVDMFLDEARLAARIRHPNVVATIDVQADDGLFIVMEYVDGPSLRALRRAWRRALPPPIALRILIDALGGLHAAHELCGDDGAPLNLVHRDVSPANILIGADGVVRITDFGVARAETRLSSTRGGQLKGKVPYMPPEQLMGEPIDRRCDVYGSGAVLWEQLAGRRLFRAESEGALLQKILAGPEYTPQQVNADVPAALDAVCMRALARSPDDR
jgi:serine/threonine-protein kinase